ncbi:MAG: hypothetical protein H6R18_2793 [Proteobacteria bacterium]|nr:hypothetical protein [Pseudomonadota bacterium]
MSQSRTILVVEDDANVALAIEAILHKNFPGVDVFKVDSCRAAWEMLQSLHFSLVISDWNMPSRTGADLLQDMRSSFRTQHIPFLMVTARSDKLSVITAIKAGASDFICKPFEKQNLVDKVASLLGMIPSEAAANVEEVGDAPAAGAPAPKPTSSVVEEITQRLKKGDVGSLMLPNVALKIQEMIRSSEASIDGVCDAVKLDPALTTKLIGIANSPYYLRSGACKTLRDAIMRIGFKEASHCIMALTTRELFNSHTPALSQILQKQWEHALATGFCAELIARKISISSTEDYFTMGLLHDIGKLLLLNIVEDLSKHRELPAPEEVDRILLSLHTAFGAELLKRWNFPASYIEIALNHHDMGYLRRCAKGLLVVGFSNLLVKALEDDGSPAVFEDALVLEFAAMLNLTRDDMQAITDEVRNYVAHVF